MNPSESHCRMPLRIAADICASINTLPGLFMLFALASNRHSFTDLLLTLFWCGLCEAPFSISSFFAFSYKRKAIKPSILRSSFSLSQALHLVLIAISILMFSLRSHPRIIPHSDFVWIPLTLLLVNLFQLSVFTLLKHDLLDLDNPLLR